MHTFEELVALYSDAIEKRDTTRRAAEEGRNKGSGRSDPQVWLLELAELEAAHALLELTAQINHADPALERLRAVLIDELELAAPGFEQTYGPGADLPATPGPLSEPTPAAVSAKVDALLASETVRLARSGRGGQRGDAVSLRLKLAFQVVYEAIGLLAVERQVRGLPSPSKPNYFVNFDLNAAVPTNSRECAALVQRIEAKRQPLAAIGTPREIGELRARIRDYQAEQQQRAEAEERFQRERLARKADESRALKQRHAEWVAEGEAQAAAIAMQQAPLTAEEVARANCT
jgi:hypothetical protein